MASRIPRHEHFDSTFFSLVPNRPRTLLGSALFWSTYIVLRSALLIGVPLFTVSLLGLLIQAVEASFDVGFWGIRWALVNVAPVFVGLVVIPGMFLVLRGTRELTRHLRSARSTEELWAAVWN